MDEYIWRCDLTKQYERYAGEINNAITRVLKSGRYTLGGEVKSFEREFAEYIGVSNALGVASGTDGLILSLKAIGIGKGDEVITSPFTAIPTVSAIIYCGATPVFVDICPEAFLIDLDKVKAAITSRTKAVLPVHIFGNVVDIVKLREIVGPKITIIEDAAQSHGSTLNGVQSGSMGDIGVFSFYPTKNLGAYGDGGMIVTNNNELAEKVKLLRVYGMIDKDHIVVNGTNSRLDELQAAILRIKLKYLDEMNKKRNNIANVYLRNLKKGLFEHQVIKEGVYSNYHVFVSRVKGDRQRLIRDLENNRIQTNVYYSIPLHLQEANSFLAKKEGSFEVAEKLCSEVIALPMYPELPSYMLEMVIKTINSLEAK